MLVYRAVIDRKKLEPIRISALANMSGNTPHYDGFSFSPGQSTTDQDVVGGGMSESGSNTLTNHVNDEELSISENTISNSDKPINIRNTRKKVEFSFLSSSNLF